MLQFTGVKVSELTETVPSAVLSLATGIVIGLALLIAPFIVAVKNPDAEKVSAFEAGFEAFDDARMKFDVRFYLVSILFIIFDLEVAFLFPWAVAFRDIDPKAPTHVLVVPRGPYVSWDDFSERAADEEIAGFVRAVGKVARGMGLVLPGYRLLANVGPHGGQEVPHLNVHLFGGTPLGPMLAR